MSSPMITIKAFLSGLGVRLEVEPELYVFMSEAVAEDLPPGWSVARDAKDRTYFVNKRDKEASWQHPLQNMYKDLCKTFRVVYRSPNKKQLIEDEFALRHREAVDLLQQWRSATTEKGETYYYHNVSGRSR
uniref:WW domain-containing protein n=1 Tax=Chromera velia CCMP2878 TaxID=1169474 RepID=A0A0G4HB68_9ALVE|eukprot:Cvel_25863.t1-p1 / transcript=Cvel_25863.t1 / gene=Cvel_25863 / organism=Chromera_velia_CCMP2878 / gene_product=hypothetical protein / transcript_product=hypothetical protein / location=Cvel_scaffold2982:19310-20638(+) / protein_length=130 / sequence_SO=supercontig / SO=protein_coding / is_pseudo=false